MRKESIQEADVTKAFESLILLDKMNKSALAPGDVDRETILSDAEQLAYSTAAFTIALFTRNNYHTTRTDLEFSHIDWHIKYPGEKTRPGTMLKIDSYMYFELMQSLFAAQSWEKFLNGNQSKLFSLGFTTQALVNADLSAKDRPGVVATLPTDYLLARTIQEVAIDQGADFPQVKAIAARPDGQSVVTPTKDNQPIFADGQPIVLLSPGTIMPEQHTTGAFETLKREYPNNPIRTPFNTYFPPRS